VSIVVDGDRLPSVSSERIRYRATTGQMLSLFLLFGLGSIFGLLGPFIWRIEPGASNPLADFRGVALSLVVVVVLEAGFLGRWVGATLTRSMSIACAVARSVGIT